ncbi:hypothetical protein ACN6LA_006894, partial [Streptomyces sp. SAS_269]
RAAIGWMLDHGGLTSRGYLVYRADEGGLANQNLRNRVWHSVYHQEGRTAAPSASPTLTP